MLYAYVLFLYPNSIFHDDSHFFIQGIHNFSVLEFSPHFPGYPSFIFTLKIINYFFKDAALSLHLLNIISTLSCIVLSTLIVKHYTNNLYSLIAFITLLSSSVVFYSALLMMSDSFGLTLFLYSYYLCIKKQKKGAGILLALALWARPSYLILILALLCIKYSKEFFISFFICSVAITLTVLGLEGLNYIKEALRFIEGHFTLWGKGEFKHSIHTKTWTDVFIHEIGIFKTILLLTPALLLLFKKNSLAVIFTAYLIWVLAAQNPNSIRHILPLIFLGHTLFSLFLFSLHNKKIKFFSLVLFLFTATLFKENFQKKEAPLMQVSDFLSNEHIIITNYGIATLRAKGFTVLDKYYLNSVNSYIKTHPNKKYAILSTQSNTLFEGFKLYKTFQGRTYLEPKLYIYKKQ